MDNMNEINLKDIPSINNLENLKNGSIDKQIIQEWFNNKIRFIEINGNWYAVLKDICDALGLKNPTIISQRINPNNLIKWNVNNDVNEVQFSSDIKRDLNNNELTYVELSSANIKQNNKDLNRIEFVSANKDIKQNLNNDVNQIELGSDNKDIKRKSGQRMSQQMLLVNEAGIYQALFESRKLEARKFVQWTSEVLCKLREKVGLKPYECIRMTDKDIQDDIDFILDTLYWDDEKKCVMQSVTVAGGDVEQVVFCK